MYSGRKNTTAAGGWVEALLHFMVDRKYMGTEEPLGQDIPTSVSEVLLPKVSKTLQNHAPQGPGHMDLWGHFRCKQDTIAGQ